MLPYRAGVHTFEGGDTRDAYLCLYTMCLCVAMATQVVNTTFDTCVYVKSSRFIDIHVVGVLV